MAITYNSTNSPLQFYRGLHTNLPTASADIIEGAFYLTTDSNRFYVGSKKGTTNYLQELNQSITTVASIAAFRSLLNNNEAEEGRFYYCIAENVLAVVHNNQVIQINPDHNETLDKHELKVTTITNGITIGSLVETDAGKKLEGDFDLISSSPVDLKFEVNTNDTYRITTDTLLNPTKTYYTAEISGDTISYTQVADSVESFADGVSYYEKFKVVNVIPAVYNFSGSVNGNNYKLTLSKTTTDGSNNNTDINITAGTNISFANSGSNSLQITAIDSNVSGVSASFDSSGQLNIGVTSDSTGTGDASASVTPKINYGKDSASRTEAKFDQSGVLTLDVYTKEQLDNEIANKFKDYNALYYRGPVTAATGDAASTIASIVTAGVHNGDVYIAQSNFTLNGDTVRVGDLLVAQGTESNGVIPSDRVTWTIIQSGNDFISVERVTGAGGGFDIEQNSLPVESIRIAADGNAKNLVVTTGYVDNANSTGIKTTVGLVWGEFSNSGS